MVFYRQLSSDGKSMARVMPHPSKDWCGGELACELILQRSGEKDISVPIQIQAAAGSGVWAIPLGAQLTFPSDRELKFRAWLGQSESKDRVWTIDVTTGMVRVETVPHVECAEDEHAEINGVPVPDYLRKQIKDFRHFGRGGLAPAFLLHLGILKEKPEYPDCTVGASPDGRHVLYSAKKGPLAGTIIYGDLLTKQTVRWKSPDGLDTRDDAEFAWVETP